MQRLAFTPRLLIALLCVAVLLLRVGGAHLHLCFDGSEPPVSMHLGDSGVHHADDAGNDGPAADGHADRDVGIGADALLKKPSGSVEIPVLAILCGLLLIYLARRRDALPVFIPAPKLSPVRTHLRPPLRGPPARR